MTNRFHAAHDIAAEPAGVYLGERPVDEPVVVRDERLRALLTPDIDGAAAAVTVLMRTATDSGVRERNMFQDTLSWALASSHALAIQDWVIEVLGWVGLEAPASMHPVPDDAIVAAAADFAVCPAVTFECLRSLMAESRSLDEVSAVFPLNAEVTASAATLAGVWMAAVTTTNAEYEDLFNLCVEEALQVGLPL